MINEDRNDNITLNNANGLPILPPPTREDKAFGSVPGWEALVNPRLDVGDVAVSRGWGGEYMQNDYGASVGINYGAFPNGVQCFDVDYDQRVRFIPAEMQINPDAWSVVVVVLPRPSTSGSAIPRVVRPNASASDDTSVALNVGWRAGPAAQVEISEQARATGGNITRLEYSPPTPLVERSTPTLLIYTGSTRAGLKIYDGGELVATNPDDKRPIEHFLGDGETTFYHNCEGQLGPVGVLSIDLGLPENEGYRNIIAKTLRDIYGIPEGPQ